MESFIKPVLIRTADYNNLDILNNLKMNLYLHEGK